MISIDQIRTQFEQLCKRDRPFPLDTTHDGTEYVYPVTQLFWQEYCKSGVYGIAR
jgi:hypothetical protein